MAGATNDDVELMAPSDTDSGGGVDEGGFEDRPHATRIEANRRRILMLVGAIAVGVALVVVLGFVFGWLYRRSSAPNNGNGSTDSTLLFDPAERLTFVMVGDWGRNGSAEQRAVAAQMGRTCEQYRCSFVVSTGDNFYDAGVRDVQDAQFRTSWADVYTAPSLRIPWYLVAGNHDHRQNVEAQVAFSALHPLWRFPDLYYTVRIGSTADPNLPFGVQLVMLDTTALIERYRQPGESYSSKIAALNGTAQLQWLQAVLALPPVHERDLRVVVGHHPVYSPTTDHAYADQLDMQQGVRRILQQYNQTLYVCGHEHSLSVSREAAQLYVVSGGGSRVRTDSLDLSLPSAAFLRYFNATQGFALLGVGPRDTQLALLDRQGQVLWRDVVPR